MLKTISKLSQIELKKKEDKESRNHMHLSVEFQKVVHREVEYSIVYFEPEGEKPIILPEVCFE